MFESQLDDLEVGETLTYLADQRAAADAAEARLLLGVAHFADLHPEVHPDDDPDLWCLEEIGAEQPVPLGGEGTPWVAEFALADLATTLRLTEGATRALLGETLELRHRLPRVWARIHEGSLQAWRGRRIAAETIALSPQAAAWVDRHVASVAHKIGRGRLLKLIAAALLQCDPRAADAQREREADGRRVLVTPPNPSGIVSVWGDLDAPDGMALDAALNRGAAALAALGDESSLDARRAKALGILADPQAALELLAGRQPERRTDLTLNVHLDEHVLAGDRGTGRVDGISELSLQTIRDWCSDATRITVKPVVNLNAQLVTEGYRPTAAQREQVLLRDTVCVFPWCDKPGRNHDLDHIEEYDATGPPGQTRSTNLARLCRYHHRVKTHGRWRYQRLPDGSYLWTNQHGSQWIVDLSGTTRISDVA